MRDSGGGWTRHMAGEVTPVGCTGLSLSLSLEGPGCLALHGTSVEDEADPWSAANVVFGEASSDIQWLMC